MRKRVLPERLTLRQLLLAGAALFVVSVLLTLSLLMSRAKRSAGAPEPELVSAPPAKAAPERLTIQEFILEDPVVEREPEIFFFRPPTSRWSEEQVRRYWIPPEEVLLEHLRLDNDRRIEELLQGVP